MQEQLINPIKVLYIEPLKTPLVVEVERDYYYTSLKELVGSELDITMPLDNYVLLVYNNIGKVLNLPFNRAIRNKDGAITDLIAGNFVILGVDEEGKTISLPPQHIDKYTHMFLEPENEDSIPSDVFEHFIGQFVYPDAHKPDPESFYVNQELLVLSGINLSDFYMKIEIDPQKPHRNGKMRKNQSSV